VVRELERKAKKAPDGLPVAKQVAVRFSIVEVQQAAYSAMVAIESDPGASDGTRRAVLDARLAIGTLKAKTTWRFGRHPLRGAALGLHPPRPLDEAAATPVLLKWGVRGGRDRTEQTDAST
jgi:hypothetical protein